MKRDWLFSDWLRNTFRHRGRRGFCERKRANTTRMIAARVPDALARTVEKHAKVHCTSPGKLVEFALRKYFRHVRARMG